MNKPLQNPPVDRLYMRSLIGRRGQPEPAKAGRSTGKGQKGKGGHPGGDYLVELTTFHLRPRRPGGRAS